MSVEQKYYALHSYDMSQDGVLLNVYLMTSPTGETVGITNSNIRYRDMAYSTSREKCDAYVTAQIGQLGRSYYKQSLELSLKDLDLV